MLWWEGGRERNSLRFRTCSQSNAHTAMFTGTRVPVHVDGQLCLWSFLGAGTITEAPELAAAKKLSLCSVPSTGNSVLTPPHPPVRDVLLPVAFLPAEPLGSLPCPRCFWDLQLSSMSHCFVSQWVISQPVPRGFPDSVCVSTFANCISAESMFFVTV